MSTDTTEQISIPYDVQKRGSHAVTFFLECVNRGESTRLAEMLALRAAPKCMTDTLMYSDLEPISKRFSRSAEEADQLNSLVRAARSKGYSPGANDIYMPEIASDWGDPDAFISPTDGREKIRKTLEKKGWSSPEGYVTTKGREPEVDPHSVRIDLPDPN